MQYHPHLAILKSFTFHLKMTGTLLLVSPADEALAYPVDSTSIEGLQHGSVKFSYWLGTMSIAGLFLFDVEYWFILY